MCVCGQGWGVCLHCRFLLFYSYHFHVGYTAPLVVQVVGIGKVYTFKVIKVISHTVGYQSSRQFIQNEGGKKGILMGEGGRKVGSGRGKIKSGWGAADWSLPPL